MAVLTNSELTALYLELSEALNEVSGGGSGSGSSSGSVSLSVNQEAALNSLADHLSDILNFTQNSNTRLGQALTSDTKTTSTCCYLILKGLAACVEALDYDNAQIQNLTAGNIRTNVINAVKADLQTAIVNDLDAQDIEAETVNVTQMLARVARLLYTVTDSIDSSTASIYHINTDDISITGADNKTTLNDGVLIIKDGNNVTRVQVGRQNNGDYNLCLWDANGTALWNAQGLTADAIQDQLITNTMIAPGLNYTKVQVSDTKTLQNVLDLLIDDTSMTELENGHTNLYRKLAQMQVTVDGFSTTVSNHTAQLNTVNTELGKMQANLSSVPYKGLNSNDGGIIAVTNSDGSVSLTGTSTSTIRYYFDQAQKTYPFGDYVYIVWCDGTGISDYNINSSTVALGTGTSLSEATDFTVTSYVSIPTGTTVNCTLKPMMVAGTVTPTQFTTPNVDSYKVNNDISTLTQTASQIQSQITNINGDVTTLTQTATGLQTQITANDVTSCVVLAADGVYIYGNAQHTGQYCKISSSGGIEFYNGTTQERMGYFDGSYLHTGNAWVDMTKEFRLGNYAWVPSATGALSLRYVGS